MNGLGLLDLPSPLLALFDQGLAGLGLPALLRVVLYGIASGWLSMVLYRHWSRQRELAELSEATRAVRRELAAYDGPFDGLLERALKLLKLNSRHLRLSFVPALLAGLPLLLILPWLSNQFSLSVPEAGSTVTIQATGLSATADLPQWTDPTAQWTPETQTWTIPWPADAASVALRWNGETLYQLPGEQPAAIVHRRRPVFNLLIGNPAGYLPDNAPLDALHLDMPTRELHGFGPGWLRGWLFCYLLIMFISALFLRWRWKLS
ncbi:hypothetical protein [Wenzhouxiangella marina]|uniref:Uncharacterized protein n=1 Tax=Wenzhouxiangella marina TaxID=1579979 RepID=A0A0K0XV17_9GAMM|nr:hypothetical protein [Wenzhouxiangella marina]AKS41523.1 hypothetical protein WM2015_1149 [Wenzhouxiangella marina]MBB6086718.1 hypothetical protein [Wenzhouxiangella marina]